jgi:hypothetical protein
MIEMIIAGNEIKNRCWDVRTGGLWSDVIASVVPDVSKECNAAILNGQEFKKGRHLGVGEYKKFRLG